MIYPSLAKRWNAGRNRFLLAPVALFLLVTFLMKRAGRLAIERVSQPRVSRPANQAESSLSPYDTPIPNLACLGPANAWRYMWESVPEHSRVLDIGCSTGYLGYWLVQTRGCLVDGVEGSPIDLALAQSRLHQTYSFNLEEHGWPQQIQDRYDVILMMDVIEHLRDSNTTLQAARRLLKPNGTLIINVPNVANWRMRFELLRGRWEYQRTGLLDQTHVRFYTLQSLEQLLVNNGFIVETILPTVPAAELMNVNLGTSRLSTWLLRSLLKAFPELLAYQLMARVHLAPR